MNEYEQQAIDFAEKIGLKMTYNYLGHYKRLSNYVTANYNIVLTRGKREYRFDYSTSINDSWQHYKSGVCVKIEGLPPRIDIDKFFDSPTCLQESFTHRMFTVSRTKKPPTLYAILACLTKYDPGSHENFCADFGYDPDSIKDLDTYLAVQKEWKQVSMMFGDVLEELSEIQ